MARGSTLTQPLAQPLALVAGIIALAVVMPVIGVAGLALRPGPDVWGHLLAYVVPQALRDTVLLLAGVSMVALLIGGGTAWLVTGHEFPMRAWMVWLLPLPLAVPTYLAAYVYVDLFEPLGWIHRALISLMPAPDALHLLPDVRSLPGGIVLIGLVLYPYVFLAVRPVLQMRAADVGEAALTLGARPGTIFRRVTLPLMRPALMVGLALVALETLNDIGASEYLGIRTLTVSIYTLWLNQGSIAGAAQLALVMLAMVGVLVALEWRSRRAAAGADSETPRLATRTRLSGWRGALACVACALPVLFGFVVPVICLAGETVRRGLAVIDTELLRAALHSVALAGGATVCALLAAFLVAIAVRWQPSRATILAATVARSGYAVPGLVLALGLLTPVLMFENGLIALARWLGLGNPGLILTSSGAIIVLAYTIRFLAVPVRYFGAALQNVPKDYDDGARAAGASRWSMLRRIHLPLMTPAVIGAAIVVFVDGLKELPATLLLRPLNVETLATHIYQYATRGNFEEGAPAALLIVAASIVPVFWLSRLGEAPRGPA